MGEQPSGSWVDGRAGDFLEALSAKVPAPGGGAAAAAAGALAAALARMVAAYSLGPKVAGDKRAVIARHADALARTDALLRVLVDEDMRAYGQYSSTKARASSDAFAAGELPALVSRMTVVPLAIAAAAGEVLENLEQLVPLANRGMLSDLEAAAILAEATVRAAGCSVRVNLPQLTAKDEAARLGEQIARLEAASRDRLAAVVAALRQRVE